MILELLILLQLKVIFFEGKTFCHERLPEARVAGCYDSVDRTIYLSYASPNINHTFWHEMAHAIFRNDTTVEEIVEPMRGFKQYWRVYPKESIASEKVADYYASYRLNLEWFEIKYPELYEHFKNTELCLSNCYTDTLICSNGESSNECTSKCTIN